MYLFLADSEFFSEFYLAHRSCVYGRVIFGSRKNDIKDSRPVTENCKEISNIKYEKVIKVFLLGESDGGLNICHKFGKIVICQYLI